MGFKEDTVRYIIFCIFLTVSSYAITCESLSDKSAFKTQPKNFADISEELFSCDKSILNLNEIKELLKLAKIIRGENPNCVGSGVYDENFNKFRWGILKAGYAPEIYKNTLAKPDVAEAQKDAQMTYFRYWGNLYLYNFLKHKQFLKAYNEAQTPLVKFYESRGIDAGSAAYYATSVVNEFLSFAVGKEYTQKSRGKMSEIQQILSDKNLNLNYLISLLYNKNYTQFELTNMLNTALLNEQRVDVLNEILKRGADINIGDETPLFYALKNIKNVEFLIKQGANVNHKNLFGKTALFYAVEFKDESLIRLLLEYGADTNATYIDTNTKNAMLNMGDQRFYENTCALEHTGRSVFMHAAAHADASILALLVSAMVDINLIDEIGFNAMDYAIINGNNNAIEYLKTLGLEPNLN
ncbi:ankyrin repeat domain-containing protein [Campylobacter sp. faydin G-24]|uniref:Ankyrin repeat domain-containing protein n=1 Tax=Campylobacter anatolicus TaxID=2829105 RepID=A0ABS5HJ40_9BACT|nr:ankyrin repeat domain-containing protein [Campylobacter anatolicus]